jgi:hypothetical protein
MLRDVVKIKIHSDAELQGFTRRELSRLKVIPGQQPPVSRTIELDIAAAEDFPLLEERDTVPCKVQRGIRAKLLPFTVLSEIARVDRPVARKHGQRRPVSCERQVDSFDALGCESIGGIFSSTLNFTTDV